MIANVTIEQKKSVKPQEKKPVRAVSMFDGVDPLGAKLSATNNDGNN